MRASMRPAWGALLGLLLLALAAQAATSSVRIKDENPLLGRTTLLWANIGLILVAGLQLAMQVQKRRHKYQLAATTPAPTAAAPAVAPAPKVLACASCATPLKIATPPGSRFRCPKCQTVGVVP